MIKATDVKVITEDRGKFLMGNLTQNQGNAAAENYAMLPELKKVVKVFNYLN